jgi:hypothetical protein
MKVSLMIFALLTCAMPTLKAGAAEPQDDKMLAVDAGGAAGRSAIRRDSNAMADRMQSRRLAQTPHGNADRLHSLLNAQAGVRIARQPGRSVGSRGIPTGAPGIRGALGAGSAARAKLVASTRPAASAPMHSILRGAQIQGPARMDGRAFTKTHGSTIDGAQLQLTRHR